MWRNRDIAMSSRVESIFDPGTASILEDRLVINPPFYGVLDGVSGLYYPDKGPSLFDGFSGGQKVVQLISNAVMFASPKDTLERVILSANASVRKFIYDEGIDAKRGDLLPGAEFAFAKIDEKKIEIIQGGDSFAVWRAKRRAVFSTPNQNYFHEISLIELLGSILKKYEGDRTKAWKEYLPVASSMRIERLNKKGDMGYVALNGQKGIDKLWNRYTISKNEVSLLLLFTDGLVKLKETKNERKMGKDIIDLYSKGGWSAVLNKIRKLEHQQGIIRHIDHAEATGLAIHL